MLASYHEVLIEKVPVFIVLVNGSVVFSTEDKAAAASMVSSFEELEKKKRYKDFGELLNYLVRERQQFWASFVEARRKYGNQPQIQSSGNDPEPY